MAQMTSFRQSLPRQGMPGDCRNPVAKEGLQAYIHVPWIPAIPAGMTMLLKHLYNQIPVSNFGTLEFMALGYPNPCAPCRSRIGCCAYKWKPSIP
ncbi:MAG: hypothetical protein ACRESZ_04140, partial [Methylococcales bacterium]